MIPLSCLHSALYFLTGGGAEISSHLLVFYSTWPFLNAAESAAGVHTHGGNNDAVCVS